MSTWMEMYDVRKTPLVLVLVLWWVPVLVCVCARMLMLVYVLVRASDVAPTLL